MMSATGQQIFLSYARDDVAFARDLRERLLALGHAPWMDLFDIPAGARWPDEIDRALRSAGAIIGVMSPSSMASENVKNEWDWAIANSRTLILLLIEPCEIPFHYVSRNYIDLTSDQAGGLAALASAIEASDAPAPAPAITPPEPDPSPQVVHEPGPLIVGRQREMSQLREALDKSLRGHGQIVLVGGEAGIGKTTLVRAILREAEQRGCLVLAGGCYDLTTTPPYGPWTEITRGYPASDDLPPLRAQLQEDGGMEGIPTQGALFDLVSTFMADVAARQPLVLLLEDLHWSDAESLALLRYVSRSLVGHRILITATYRDDELTRRHPLALLLPRLVREASAERVAVRHLEIDAIRDLIRDRYDLIENDKTRLASYLEERSEGNPLYVEELLYTMEAEGSLAQDSDGSWKVGELDAVPVPLLIIQLIEERLATLNPRTHELLQILAVIGQEVAIDLWSQVSGADDAELIDATRQALDARIATEVSCGARIRFHHALIREALTTELVSLERQRWHRRTADILIAAPNPDPDAVVTHFERANDPRLIGWLIRAGERAEQRLAWDVAVERYQDALRHLDQLQQADPGRITDLLMKLGNAQIIGGTSRETGATPFDHDLPRATFLRAAELARANGLNETYGRAVFAATGVELTPFIPRASEFADMLEDALERLPEGAEQLNINLLTALGITHWSIAGSLDLPFVSESTTKARQYLSEALHAAREMNEPKALGYTLLAQSSRPMPEADTDDLIAEANEIVDLARLVQDRVLLSHGLNRVISISIRRGEIEEANRSLDALEHLAQEVKIPYLLWDTIVFRSGWALGSGNFEEAHELLGESIRMWPGAIVNLWQRLEISQEQEHKDDIIALERDVDQRFPADQYPEYWWRVFRIRCLLNQGRFDDASASFNAIPAQLWKNLRLVLFDEVYSGLTWLAALAMLSYELEDADRALIAYEAISPYAHLYVYNETMFGYPQGSVDHYLGLAAIALRRWDDGASHLERAIVANTDKGFRPYVARSQYHYADMLHRRAEPGDRYHALELLDQALGLARDIGMVRLERMATELQERLKEEAR